MAYEKLSDDQIQKLESWADQKRKLPMSKTEESIVKKIEDSRKNNWRGYRISEKPLTLNECQEHFERLKGKA